MLRLLMVAEGTEALAGLRAEITRNGFACSIVPPGEDLVAEVAAQRPDLLLVDLAVDGALSLVPELKKEKQLPVIALVPGEALSSLDGDSNIDDFITSPYDAGELALRARLVLNRARNINGGELIKCDRLVIDLASCEVTLEGEVIELTFKEYELLKFLASHRGRVFNREALLNQVWQYDYFGGDRTVDVHIRRLRSKIEDASHTFVETVRNIGYRFKA